MDFLEVIGTQRAEIVVVAPIPETETPVLEQILTEQDIPAGMLLTNRLDKMNVEQAVWAIRNGDAWLAYLKSNGGESFPPA